MPVPTVSGLAVLCTGSVDGWAGGLLNKVCRFVRQLKIPLRKQPIRGGIAVENLLSKVFQTRSTRD